MTEKKEKKRQLKSLIGFLSANKIDTYNGAGGGKKNPKNLQNKLKNNNKCFSWVTAVGVLPHAGNHSSVHLPRMPSNTVLILFTAVGAAQTLIWSCSCVLLPPISTAIRASAFSFVGALSGLLHIPYTQSLLSWSCEFNLQPVQLVGRFWVFFLSRTAAGFQLWFYSTSTWGSSAGVYLAPEASLEGLGLLLWGPGVEVVQVLGSHGFWQHQVLRGIVR